MKVLITAFVLIVSAQIFVPAKMIYDEQAPRLHGQELSFKTRPIDPHDPFRGKYVTLDFGDNNIEVDGSEKWRRGQLAFVEFEINQDGFAIISKIHKQVPSHTKYYLKTKVTRVDRGGVCTVYVDYPFKRYYMDEFKAKQAEQITMNSNRERPYEVSAVVYVYEGKASLNKLQVEDIPMEEAVEDDRYSRH